MAEFALGLTKTAVEGTLSRVKSAIEEEARLKEKVRHDLLFITAEFQMMQSFLYVANKERAKNQVVRTWVRQLRDLAFDVEDCVEFVVHLDNKSGWWWRMVPSCVVPQWHRQLDEAAAEIKLLKARVEDVSQRNTRYNLISDSGSHSHTTKTITVAERPASATANPSAFPLLWEVWEAAGRISNIHNLQDLITRESSDLQVISVWGSTRADLGATSIFRKVYYNKKVRQEFRIRVWLKLMHPFDRDEFFKSLMIQLCTSSHQAILGTEDFRTRMKEATVVTEDDLIKAEQLMKENRYLVVLEEVSTLVEWDAIKNYLPDYKNGSRIVISTQDIGVALMCTGEPYKVSELRQFSDGQSICAFSRTVTSRRRRDLCELVRLIRQGGVISVYGHTRSKFELIKKLFEQIKWACIEFDILISAFRWVDFSDPRNKMDFPQWLSRKIKECRPEANKDDNATVDQSLIDDDFMLVVIDGLQSTQDWDSIKATLLSQHIKGSMIVITNEEHVAKHCVDDEEDRAINYEYLVAEGLREKEAREWINKFQLAVPEDYKRLPLEHPVVALWGIAGVGKSAFVRNSYYSYMLEYLDKSVLNIFRSSRFCGWVDVPHPFNLIELSWRLLLDFHSDDLTSKEAAAVGIMEGQDPIQGCRNILREYSCLVVFDGLRSKHEWDIIKDTLLSRGSTSTNIIVITNEESVVSYCTTNRGESVVNVKGLEADNALCLLKKIVIPDNYWTTEELMSDILEKCGGLPKVITAVGKYCHRQKNMMKDINERFMHMLETDVENFDCLRGLFSWMRSYFEDCKDQLKPCIFYLPIFSTNHNIRRRRLLNRWIAEGYSRDTSSGTAEENGERLFSELVDLSIIQQQSSNKSRCRVNGFFREYIMSRPMEDNLVFALAGHCNLNSQLIGQHLTIRESWDRDINVFESIDFSSLRSLTVLGEWRPFFISTNNNMRLLRVLDLEDTSNLTDDDLEQIGRLLPRLKFLSLRGCREISRLPDSLGGLRQLQTLDVRHTSIATLPHGIIKLQKLQYIRASTKKQPWNEDGRVITLTAADYDRMLTLAEEGDGTRPNQQPAAAPSTQTEEGAGTGSSPSETGSPGVVQKSTQSRSRPHTLVSSWFSKLCCTTQRPLNNCGVKVPAGIRKLMALHTLGVVDVSGVGGNAILAELKNLSQLRRLGLCGINRENLKDMCSAISGHSHMESLSVQVDKDEEQSFLCCFNDTISQPPKNLKILKLYGYVQILQGSWMKHLDNLENLEMAIFRQDDIHILDELRCFWKLCRLSVKLIQEGELHFRSLKGLYCILVLEIDCTSKLQVTFYQYILEHVVVLKLHCSSGSSLRLSGLEHLVNLKEVWFKGSYGNELKQDLHQQLSKHPKKPVLKLVLS